METLQNINNFMALNADCQSYEKAYRSFNWTVKCEMF